MKRLAIILFVGLLVGQKLAAQVAQPYLHHTERSKNKKDTSTLQAFFRNGEFYGHARYYFMATDNAGDLKDFYANAFGMGIGYETGQFKGFQIGISGFFIYNLASSDFTKTDASTGIGSRYEIGQFDMTNPKNKRDMDRLEDLYLKYSFKASHVKLGKQHIRSPFLNPQDGRMRPTLIEGALLELNEIKHLKLEAAYIFGISPRSTVNYYGIGESMSIFPAGIGLDGKKSQYPGNVNSSAIYLASATIELPFKAKLQILNQHVDQVLNSSFAQLTGQFGLNQNKSIFYGAQYIQQHAVGNGGNVNPNLSYVKSGNLARTFGFRLGLEEKKNWQIFANYNRITKDGRYLMPREWGRDPFFTFMARERNEGFADVHAMNLVSNKVWPKQGLKIEVAYGHYYLPDIMNVAHNKYAMPSYFQGNVDVRYNFKGFLSGLEGQFLYVYKGNLGNTYENNRNIINKVNMSLYNLVLNYHF